MVVAKLRILCREMMKRKEKRKKTLTNWKLHIELVAFIFKES
jgi:hypothetical protein